MLKSLRATRNAQRLQLATCALLLLLRARCCSTKKDKTQKKPPFPLFSGQTQTAQCVGARGGNFGIKLGLVSSTPPALFQDFPPRAFLSILSILM
jgi:hypothetical protein